MFERILLVLDGGEGWTDAADFAIKMASALKSQLMAVSTVDTDTLTRLLQRHIFVEEERAMYERDLEEDAGRYLNHVSKLAAKVGVTVEKRVIKGSIHRAVLQEAHTWKADAIVIPSWSRSMLRRDLIPHERQLLLDEAECAVVVVRSTEATTPHGRR